MEYHTCQVIATDLADNRHIATLYAASIISDRTAMLILNLSDSEGASMPSIGLEEYVKPFTSGFVALKYSFVYVRML